MLRLCNVKSYYNTPERSSHGENADTAVESFPDSVYSGKEGSLRQMSYTCTLTNRKVRNFTTKYDLCIDNRQCGECKPLVTVLFLLYPSRPVRCDQDDVDSAANSPGSKLHLLLNKRLRRKQSILFIDLFRKQRIVL